MLNGLAKDQRFSHADSEDSDQTGWMHWLIQIFAGRTDHFVGFVMQWPKYKHISSFSLVKIRYGGLA